MLSVKLRQEMETENQTYLHNKVLVMIGNKIFISFQEMKSIMTYPPPLTSDARHKDLNYRLSAPFGLFFLFYDNNGMKCDVMLNSGNTSPQ